METQQNNEIDVLDILSYLKQEEIAARLNGWEEDFTESILEQWIDKQRLSQRQEEIIRKIYSKHSPEAITLTKSYEEEFRSSEEMMERWRLAVRYYRETGYFSHAVDAYDRIENYIPPQNLYEKMTDNKWFNRFFEMKQTEPKFHVGQLVRLTSKRPGSTYFSTIFSSGPIKEYCGYDKEGWNMPSPYEFRKLCRGGVRWRELMENKTARLIIEDIPDFVPVSNAAGSRLYKVKDIFGTYEHVILEERHLRAI